MNQRMAVPWHGCAKTKLASTRVVALHSFTILVTFFGTVVGPLVLSFFFPFSFFRELCGTLAAEDAR